MARCVFPSLPKMPCSLTSDKVLFFDDPSTISKLPPPFQPLFTEFPNVQDHASGMLQFVVWTALAAEGLGCNLQHYQPHIDPWVREK